MINPFEDFEGWRRQRNREIADEWLRKSEEQQEGEKRHRKEKVARERHESVMTMVVILIGLVILYLLYLLGRTGCGGFLLAVLIFAALCTAIAMAEPC